MDKKIYYYRIYDDKEQKSYFKCTKEPKEVKMLLKEFEATHQEYYNFDFLKFLKEKNSEAELIEIHNIYY